jgi:predicted phosphate transport protein (TIGR00153 family)
MGSLIDLKFKKSAENVLEMSINHAQKVQECVRELQKGINVLLEEKEQQKAYKIFKKVDSLENEGDGIRRKILRLISKSQLNPSVRGDLSHLIKNQDEVANCACGVARRIATIPNEFWEQSSEESIELIVKMADKTVDCVEYLDKIVNDLLHERKNIKNFYKKINKLEHDVDILNIKLRGNLQKTDYHVNAFTIFTVGNTIDIIEAISDSIETVADYIMSLLTSSNVI